MKKIILLSFAIFFIIGIQSCGSGDNHKSEEITEATPTADQLSPEAVVNLGLVMVNIPSPTLIMASLSRSNLKFDKTLINPLERAGSYSSTYQVAINLGVYGADLGYVSVFNQSQEVLAYFNQVNSMAEKIGVAGVFDKEFFNEINSNLGNPDTLDALMSIAFQKMHDNLKSNDRLSTTAIAMAGGWIEGLHLALATLQNETPNKELINRIWNHIYAFKYVIHLLESFKETNPNCATAFNDFHELHAALFPFIEKPEIGREDLPNIKELVDKTRAKIVA